MSDTWRWWPGGRETVRILAEAGNGPTAVSQIVVPSRGVVQRVASDRLQPVRTRPWTSDELIWRAAAARAITALAPPGAVATHNSNLEPLPHQVVALERALATNPVRLLLADEVGLGKTIEAGMIISELKARGRIKRILVVAPKGVQLQWIAELGQRFQEEFVLVGPSGIPVDAGINPWTTFNQVVCSLDSIKPLRLRQGWTPDTVNEYNQLRSEAVCDAGWDLVVFDEAHHVSGSSHDVARHRLAVDLARVTPHVLLLSATPHSGKSDAFSRLLGLLDERFAQGQPATKTTVAPLVVRSDKRHTTDTHGHPLFQPRTTRLHLTPYTGRDIERRLYEAVTEYVRHGYRRAKLEKRPAVGFLVLLMQRLASSSTAAVFSALQRRLLAILAEGTQLQLFPEGAEAWGDLSGEEQVAAMQDALGAAWGDERAEVELLLDLARRALSNGLDAKARDLLSLLDELAAQEADPSLKVVIFTEFTETQNMLLELFESTGIDAVAINGRLGIHERATVQDAFRDRARVLVSTDAGGEGINLQFSHVVINYDLPWSPTRIEQRFGRVDRIGQRRPVHAINLAMEHSIDARVLGVLLAKLDVIRDELGVDKTSDILNSADQHAEGVYIAAIDGQDLDEAATTFEVQTRSDTREAATFLDLVEPAALRPTIGDGADPNVWIDRALTARAAVRGTAESGAVLDVLPEVSPAEPVPQISGPGSGLLSIWEVGTSRSDRTCRAVFVTDDGAVRPDLADRTWDALLTGPVVACSNPLNADAWAHLWETGQGYAIRPDQRSDLRSPPALLLRLLVRVQQ